ncbi:MAG: copper resistance protein CopC, partial [bacterium]
PGLAHALVERSDPPANRLVLAPPKEILLVFTEPVDPRRTEITVLDQGGARIATEPVRVSADRRQARVPIQLPGPGIYTVSWRTVSTVDLHTYEGFFSFTLGPLRPGSFALQTRAGGPTPWEIAVRWLLFVGAALLAGGLVVHRLLLPLAVKIQLPEAHLVTRLWHRWRWTVALAVGAVVVGTVGEAFGQAIAISRAAGETGTAALIQLAAGGSAQTFGWLKILPAVILLGLVGRMPPRASAPAMGLVAGTSSPTVRVTTELALAGGILLGISLTSHAAAAGQPLPMIADWLHLVSAAVWIGGLIYMGVVLTPLLKQLEPNDRSAVLGPLVQHFSNLALTSVSVLVITGLYAAWRNIPAFEALISTSYGRVLSVKVLLLIPLLGIAGVNLLIIRPQLVEVARRLAAAAREGLLQRWFIRLVRSEVALASLVLLAAAALALLPTARQVTALGGAREIVLVRRAETLEGVLQITPYQVGENAFVFRLHNLESGRPMSDARVRVTFMPLAANLGTTLADATPTGNGQYEFQGTFLGTRGPLLVTVTVRQRGQNDVELQVPVEPDWVRGSPVRPATDPEALALLKQAEQVMNRLRSLRQRQEITDGVGNDVITFFELVAPATVHYRVIGGTEAIGIGQTWFTREGKAWRRGTGPDFKFPNFQLSGQASSVVFGPQDTLDGLRAQVVTFIIGVGSVEARYSVWVDPSTKRIVREAMVARGHYMTIVNYDFNAPIRLPVRTP